MWLSTRPPRPHAWRVRYRPCDKACAAHRTPLASPSPASSTASANPVVSSIASLGQRSRTILASASPSTLPGMIMSLITRCELSGARFQEGERRDRRSRPRQRDSPATSIWAATIARTSALSSTTRTLSGSAGKRNPAASAAPDRPPAATCAAERAARSFPCPRRWRAESYRPIDGRSRGPC